MNGNIRGFEDCLKHTLLLAPIAVTADAPSASVDMVQYGSAAFYVSIGADGQTLGASHHFQLELQECDDNSTWTAVANANCTNTVTGTNVGTFAKVDAAGECDAVYMTEYLGHARYVRVNINITGTVSSPVGVMSVQGYAKSLPVA